MSETVLSFGSVILEAYFSCSAAGFNDPTCNFKCSPEGSAGRPTTMPVSFSHKIYEKSDWYRVASSEPRIDGPI